MEFSKKLGCPRPSEAPGGNAIALIEIDGELPPAVLAAVRALPWVQQARPLKFCWLKS